MKKEIDALSMKFLKSISKNIKKPVTRYDYVIKISLKDIHSFSKELYESIISEPEETIEKLEKNLSDITQYKDLRIRLIDYDILKKIKIRHIRAEHLDKLLHLEGYVIQVSEVRPQVVKAIFECSKCKTKIEVLQIEKKFREPSGCSCGNKKRFYLTSKTMVDAQRIILAEEKGDFEKNISPRINIFLKEDLTAPKMNILENIGKKAKVLGVLNEVPIPCEYKGIYTRFEICIEANNILF